VANVTHELKTPLTSISGFVETLQDGAAEDPEVRNKFLDIIAIETARLKRLIEDILIISDIENKREVNTDSDINVRESIEEILASMKPIIEAKGVKVITYYAYEIYIGGNPDRFKQLMVNLIENAVKYSYDGGTVTITAKRKEGKVYISVNDEGIGISEENLSRIFERFYRVDKSRSQKVGGTGLGLAIVKHIAALFEAEIQVESEPGKGSTFTVIFK
jgi:two-component system phosphate regulon sensor histidine kinase PhoR